MYGGGSSPTTSSYFGGADGSSVVSGADGSVAEGGADGAAEVVEVCLRGAASIELEGGAALPRTRRPKERRRLPPPEMKYKDRKCCCVCYGNKTINRLSLPSSDGSGALYTLL